MNSKIGGIQNVPALNKQSDDLSLFHHFLTDTTPIFKSLKIVKFLDLIKFTTSVFMYKFYKNLFPPIFSNFFTSVRNIHNYNTRLASKTSFALPTSRTNYGIFSLRFQGPKTWNNIDESLKHCSLTLFKMKLKNLLISHY